MKEEGEGERKMGGLASVAEPYGQQIKVAFDWTVTESANFYFAFLLRLLFSFSILYDYIHHLSLKSDFFCFFIYGSQTI